MDELYTLEREEARRRAEYEARHAEALRRVSQRENRHAGRLSKSATTSPVGTPLRPNISLSSGTSAERDWQAGGGEDAKKTDDTKRRLSGPAWQMTPISHEPSLGHTHTTGHVVDASTIAGGRQHVHWSHPYPTHSQTHSYQYRHLARQDDTPSPLSSDSDSLPPHNSAHSPPHPFSIQQYSMHAAGPGDSSMRPAELAFTPSTSPFLGPLRTLNLHSADTSRAPSPILLPPAGMSSGVVVDGSISPIEESPRGYGPRSRGTSIAGSPPNASIHSRAGAKRKGAGDDKPYYMSSLPHSYPSQLAQLTERGPPSSLHTPQLSSGPSSDSSSPRSVSHPIGIDAHSTAAPYHFDSGSGTPSALNSRSSSPIHPLHPSHQFNTWVGGVPPHNHLAHSVRKAFDMTPIRLPPRNTSWPSSLSTLSAQAHLDTSPADQNNIFSLSVPASRSGSPPIILPPLKMSSSASSPSHEGHDDGETARSTKRMQTSERLPGFHEFEAASCAPGR
jgi:zinc finger protein CreA/MIG